MYEGCKISLYLPSLPIPRGREWNTPTRAIKIQQKIHDTHTRTFVYNKRKEGFVWSWPLNMTLEILVSGLLCNFSVDFVLQFIVQCHLVLPVAVSLVVDII